jgi:hypothetical protein
VTEARAIRYRRLALAEQDADAAKSLRQIADEAERGVLCVAERPATGPVNVPIAAEPKP